MANLEGATTGLGAEIDPNQSTIRLSIRPLEHIYAGKIYGHYSWYNSVPNNLNSEMAPAKVTTPAANAVLMAARWTEPNSYAVIFRVQFCVQQQATGAVQSVNPVSLFAVRNYSVPDTTASFARLSINVNSGASLTHRLRKEMLPPRMTAYVAQDAGTTISGGTKTVDPNPIGSLVIPGSVSNTTQVGVSGDLYRYDQIGQHPLVLGYQDGFQIQWGSVAATGTTNIFFGFEWAEVAAY